MGGFFGVKKYFQKFFCHREHFAFLTLGYPWRGITCTEQAKRDLRHHARPALATLPENFEDYDEIYLGYPNYWGTMPMAVYTFLERFDFTVKTIHPFCTHEGSGLSGTVNDIRQAAKGASVSMGLAVCGSYVDKAEPEISEWVHEVQN